MNRTYGSFRRPKPACVGTVGQCFMCVRSHEINSWSFQCPNHPHKAPRLFFGSTWIVISIIYSISVADLPTKSAELLDTAVLHAANKSSSFSFLADHCLVIPYTAFEVFEKPPKRYNPPNSLNLKYHYFRSMRTNEWNKNQTWT